MQPDADRLEDHLIENGGSMSVADLQHQLRNNELRALKRTLAKTRMTLRSFLRAFPQTFRVQRGRVSVLRDLPSDVEDAPPAPGPPAAGPTPLMRFLDRSRAASTRPGR